MQSIQIALVLLLVGIRPASELCGQSPVLSTTISADDSIGYGLRIEQLEAEVAELRALAGCSDCQSKSCSKQTSYPTVKLTGFAQADYAYIGQTELNRQTVGDVQDGADFRRARLGAAGDLVSNLEYFIEFDFAFASRLNITDLYLDIHDLTPVGTVRIGRWRLPFGMDPLTSVKELTFVERALPFTFSPFRQIGFGLPDILETDDATWSLAAFRFPTDEFGGNVGDSGGWGLASRNTVVVLESSDGEDVVHLGFAYSGFDPSDDRVRYATSPEFFIGETGGSVPAGVPARVPPFVDTGEIMTNFVHLFGGELGGTLGPLHYQGEITYAVVDQMNGPTSMFFGAYGQLGYILTGEHRPYNRANGALGRIVPEHSIGECDSIGAWEAAIRISTIDLIDEDIQGGRLTDFSAGLNWYLARNAKLQFNYIRAWLGHPQFGDSHADIAIARMQFDF